MNRFSDTKKSQASILAKIKSYKSRGAEMRKYLAKYPCEWGRFQSEFNQQVNYLFNELMMLEKEFYEKEQEDKLYRLKTFFINRLRMNFVVGPLCTWSFKKPYGYAGDHKIIDDIYRNHPVSTGFERLFDNYFQMSSISVAVRNRKEDFKRIICEYAEKSPAKTLKIMDVACGPCREVKELLSASEGGLAKKAEFYCLDADERAIEYAQKLLCHDERVHFTHMNIVRLALSKDPKKDFTAGFDVIYSTGLFDYLDDRISTRLIQNLRHLLKPGGILAISDVRDKFSNPSIYFMEWAGDWNLIYRCDDAFRMFFKDAGFSSSELSFGFEQQGILQYVIATRT